MPFHADELANMTSKSLLEILDIPRESSRAKIAEAYARQLTIYNPVATPPEATQERELLEKICARLKDAHELLVASLDAADAESVGDWERAHKLMARVIDLHSEDSYFRARMGWYTFHCTKIESGERERITTYQLEYALELDKTNALAHYYLGEVSLALRNPGRAKAEFAAAVAVNPSFEAAKKALDTLSGTLPAASSAQHVAAKPTRFSTKKAKISYGLLFLLVVVSAGVGVVWYGKLNEPAAYNIPIASASIKKEGKTLKLELGAAWENMNSVQREQSLQTAFDAAKKRGLDTIEVTSQGVPVARVVNGMVEPIAPPKK
jgi:tetratricopeptide (TPR) repeat protein